MASATVEFGGERMGEEAGPTAGSSLAPRPVRAAANNASAWSAPTPIVPTNSHCGPTTTRVTMEQACGGMS